MFYGGILATNLNVLGFAHEPRSSGCSDLNPLQRAEGSNAPICVSHLAMQPYTSSRMMMTTRLMMTAVVVTVTRTLERPEGVELMARAAAVEIL